MWFPPSGCAVMKIEKAKFLFDILHKNKVLHLDINYGNILYDSESDNVFIIDFETLVDLTDILPKISASANIREKLSTDEDRIYFNCEMSLAYGTKCNFNNINDYLFDLEKARIEYLISSMEEHLIFYIKIRFYI